MPRFITLTDPNQQALRINVDEIQLYSQDAAQQAAGVVRVLMTTTYGEVVNNSAGEPAVAVNKSVQHLVTESIADLDAMLA